MLHGVADRVVPIAGQRGFVHALREHYSNLGAPTDLVEMVEYPENGAPDEHAGFGRLGNDAKNAQTAFLRRVLGA
ncbi:hypothetical protein J4558_25960 [Leptolyngbya sp. 15MV]|nr:hypothetical protein J4558_25960 [Leptolyngbya sp. 15MV]